MLNKDELYYIANHLVEDTSEEGTKVKAKLSILLEQLNLQEEFRMRSQELQDKIKKEGLDK